MTFYNKISNVRHLVTQIKSPHYVTTPIFYVNAGTKLKKNRRLKQTTNPVQFSSSHRSLILRGHH